MPGSVNCTYINDPICQAASFPYHIPQPDTIYIWHGITADLLHLYPRCYALLNTDEQARANRYFQTADRQRFVIQHGLLRQLLGWYLNMPVFADAFIHGDTGKPYLPTTNTQPCFFNLSNSAGAFLIAIGDTELGVDIEQLKPGFIYQDIMSQYFGTNERLFITEATNPIEAFFLLWTRKEALLKATGKGIDDDLPQVPALNGKHALPGNYNDVDRLTESFKAGENMVSVTYSSHPMDLQLVQLSY